MAPEPISCTQTAKARRLHGWKGELRKWVEQSIANEKPAFVAIMIGMNDRHSMQALVAARETNPPPVKPNERPVAGPVVPLTETPPVKGDALLGATRPPRSDARLLGGEPAAPARGRADDFSWPRAQEAPAVVQEGPGYAQGDSDVAPRSGKSRPRGSSRKSGEDVR